MAVPTRTRIYRLVKTRGLKEVALPSLESTEVLVKIHAVSLHSRGIQLSRGIYSKDKLENFVPLSDMAGEIIALGEDVNKKWKKGDRVSANFVLGHIAGETNTEIRSIALGKPPTDGVLTEYTVFLAHSLVRIPDYMTYEDASTLPCAALTAYNALHGPTPIKGGNFVLVEGTGGVSIFGLQLAVAAGASVIATPSSDEKLLKAKKLGAKYVINYRTTPQWDIEILKNTKGRGVDHVLEVLPSGWLHLIGCTTATRRQGGDIDELVMLQVTRSLNVRGIQVGSRSQFEDMNRFLKSPHIKPVIDKAVYFER